MPRSSTPRMVRRRAQMDTVIFLDVDGVLHSLYGDDLFRENCCALLARIVRTTDASIVLSSSWRTEAGKVAIINGVLKQWNLPTACDSTKSLDTPREGEICEWLDRHPHVSRWIAIDDMDLLRKPSVYSQRLRGHFVRTKPEDGLTPPDAELAIRLLLSQEDSTASLPSRFGVDASRSPFSCPADFTKLASLSFVPPPFAEVLASYVPPPLAEVVNASNQAVSACRSNQVDQFSKQQQSASYVPPPFAEVVDFTKQVSSFTQPPFAECVPQTKMQSPSFIPLPRPRLDDAAASMASMDTGSYRPAIPRTQPEVACAPTTSRQEIPPNGASPRISHLPPQTQRSLRRNQTLAAPSCVPLIPADQRSPRMETRDIGRRVNHYQSYSATAASPMAQTRSAACVSARDSHYQSCSAVSMSPVGGGSPQQAYRHAGTKSARGNHYQSCVGVNASPQASHARSDSARGSRYQVCAGSSASPMACASPQVRSRQDRRPIGGSGFENSEVSHPSRKPLSAVPVAAVPILSRPANCNVQVTCSVVSCAGS